MNRISQKAMRTWASLGPKFLPFADAATPELPLLRLLRLSLFQVSVGMALTLLIGTLNRVMIVELHVPVSLVAVMISLPLIAAPFRTLIGFRSDTTVLRWAGGACPSFSVARCCSSAAWRSCPSRCWCWPALARRKTSPRSSAISRRPSPSCWSAPAYTQSKRSASHLPPTSRPPSSQPKVVGLMYVMLLFGMIAARCCSAGC